jgi:hypothetical protein
MVISASHDPHDDSMRASRGHPSEAGEKCKPIPQAFSHTLHFCHRQKKDHLSKTAMRHSLIALFLIQAPLVSAETITPSALSAVFDQSAELKKAWDQCPADQKKGMEFLLTNMPPRDVKSLHAEFLLENVKLAYQARKEMPWGKDIPEEIFLNDVLPYAVLDETRDNWRADFYTRFKKIAADATTAAQALERINAAITTEVGVEYNTKRRAPNQGPYESMQLKMASCTGLSILLADALRSVCIPCRIAGTAMWTTMEGNHNWNEVWLPEQKRWMITEYTPDKKGLDHAWFIADAARGIPGSVAHGIYATSWEKSQQHFPMVWNMRDTSVPGMDVTQRYIDLGAKHMVKPGECELRIEAYLIQADGTKKREALDIEVRQFDVIVAKGKTPSPTADMNEFLRIRVPQGVRYQVVIPDQDPNRPRAMEAIAPKNKEEFLRVKLEVK